MSIPRIILSLDIQWSLKMLLWNQSTLNLMALVGPAVYPMKFWVAYNTWCIYYTCIVWFKIWSPNSKTCFNYNVRVAFVAAALHVHGSPEGCNQALPPPAQWRTSLKVLPLEKKLKVPTYWRSRAPKRRTLIITLRNEVWKAFQKLPFTWWVETEWI